MPASSEIDEFMPLLRGWVRRVFAVLGGQALAAGGLTVFVAATGFTAVTRLLLSHWRSLAPSQSLMAAANFTIRFDF